MSSALINQQTEEFPIVTATTQKTDPVTATPQKTDPEPLADDVATQLAQSFKLLADATRIRILYFLVQREELNVRTLCELLQQSQPAVSHHLALMRVAGIIASRRQGKNNFYHIVSEKIEQIQKTIDQVFGKKLSI